MQYLSTHWSQHDRFEPKIWQTEADFTVKQLIGYQSMALASVEGKIIWEVSVANSTTEPEFASLIQPGQLKQINFNLNQPLIEVVSDKNTPQKESFLVIYNPLVVKNKFKGVIVAILDFKPILNSLTNLLDFDDINILNNNKPIYLSQNKEDITCQNYSQIKQLYLPIESTLNLQICYPKHTLIFSKLEIYKIFFLSGLTMTIVLPILIQYWQTARHKTKQMSVLNQHLASEIQEKVQAQSDLLKLNEELEQRVAERTKEFQQINQQLRDEIIDREKAELALAESESLYRQMIETAEEGIWILDSENRTYFVNQKIAQMLGYTVEEMIDRSVLEFMDRAWQKKYLAHLQRHRQGINEQHDFKFRRKDNSPLWVIISTSPIFDNCGNYSGSLRMITDISDRKETEEQLKKSLQEKEVLLKEINHRLKNNLLVIATLLELQAERLEDRATIQLFEDTQQRIHSMALIHEKLFQSPDLAKVNFGNYLRVLAEEIAYSYNFYQRNIELKLSLQSVELNLETANPCGLIVNELLVNTVKHAFPAGRSGIVWLKLEKNYQNLMTLIVEDNGIGFPSNLDFRTSESLGLQLVNTLTEQIEGELQLKRHPTTLFKLTFSELKYKNRL